MKKSTVFLGIIDTLIIVFFFVVYGPFTYFKTLWITTAMNTFTHKYLANVLYSQKTIDYIMSMNETIAVDEDTDASLIDLNLKNQDIYDDIYEEQVLKKEHPDDVYKLIEFDGEGYHAYLTVVYDPSRVMTTKSSMYGDRGEYTSIMGAKANALVAINGGGFVDIYGDSDGARASGVFISQGKVIESSYGRYGIIGMTKDNVLTLGYMSSYEAEAKGIRDAVCFGPFLIVNGKSSAIKGNGGYGVNPRTAIAQRKDGIMLFLTIDGSGNKYGFRGGATISEVISILERYKAYNAANLDGGASTVLAFNGKTYNHPVAYSPSGERWLPNAWIVK